MSLYIKLQLNFWSHRKTAKLQSIIGNDALWIMPKLWCYAAANQPDGNFSKYTAAELAIHLGYSGDPQALLQALLDAGFIDQDKTLHDWYEYNSFHAVFKERSMKAALASKLARQERASTIQMIGEDTSLASSSASSSEKHAEYREIAKKAIDYLNHHAGTGFRHADTTLGPVIARLNSGATKDDIKLVIDAKVKEWKNDLKMQKYLRPATLFGKEKFDQYLGLARKNQNNPMWNPNK